MIHQSVIQKIGPVTFPAFTGERVYMRAFTQRSGLPADLARWQPTVDAMLGGIDAPGDIYLMIDQGEVAPYASHRRPGLHVDGYWNPATRNHRGGGHGSISAHGSLPPRPGHTGRVGSGWDHCDFTAPEALILASDVSAARGYAGPWTGTVGEGGDCSGIDTSGLRELRLASHTVYAGNAAFLHESLPIASGGRRTLVRLNVPGWTPSA